MDIKQLYTDNTAVSPVIGVILMVAITVILAAVIATFALGGNLLGASAPTAQLSADIDNSENTITITHEGGSSLDPSTLTIQGTEQTTVDNENRITAGTTFQHDDDGTLTSEYDIESGASEVRVVWQEDGGDSTATLRTFSV